MSMWGQKRQMDNISLSIGNDSIKSLWWLWASKFQKLKDNMECAVRSLYQSSIALCDHISKNAWDSLVYITKDDFQNWHFFHLERGVCWEQKSMSLRSFNSFSFFPATMVQVTFCSLQSILITAWRIIFSKYKCKHVSHTFNKKEKKKTKSKPLA